MIGDGKVTSAPRTTARGAPTTATPGAPRTTARGALRAVALGVLAATLLTVFTGAPARAAGEDVVGCHPEWPVVAHHAGGAAAQLPSGSALPVACATQTGYATSESTLGVTGSGVIFYSPAHSENSVGLSLDHAATWRLAYPPDEQYTALWNTDDPYLIVDRRTSRVFWSHATGDLRDAPILVANSPLPSGLPTALAYAHGFQLYSTSGDGHSWKTADYSSAPMGDWDKVFAGPPPAASTGAAQPSGYPDVVYVCANSPFEVSGPGRLCYRSLDGGATFSPAGYVYPTASTPDTCSPFGANNAVVGSDGTIYHPVSCQNGSYLVVSHDEGSSYSWLPVRGAPPSPSLLTLGPMQVAIDDADNLYVAWQASDHVYLAISRDHGQSWTAPLQVSVPGVHNIALPALAAGHRGEVGITYYATRDASAQMLSAYVTQTSDALDAQPVFYSGVLNDPAHPIFRNYGLGGPSPRADYVGATYDAAGTLWAGLARQLGPPDSNGNIATTGYVGRLAFTAGTATALVPSSPTGAPSACLTQKRLTFRINRVPHGRVVRAVVYVNGRRILARRGRNLTRLSFARPRGQTLKVKIVTINNRGGSVVTRRTFRACTRTRVRGKVHRHRGG